MDDGRSYDGSVGPWCGRGFGSQQNATMNATMSLIARSLFTCSISREYGQHNDEGGQHHCESFTIEQLREVVPVCMMDRSGSYNSNIRTL